MKKLRLSSQVRKAFRGSSKGRTLIEVIIATALTGVIAVGFLGTLSGVTNILIFADKRATAESLARSQSEYVKNQEYIDYSDPDHEDYAVINGCPEGYTIEVIAEPINMETGQPYPYNEEEGAFDGDDGIQRITVIVRHDDKAVINLEGYKREPVT